jgi:peptidoglycan/LPS O-acetylase OafA/YrhL
MIRALAALIVFSGHLTKIDEFKVYMGNYIMLLNWGTEAVIVFFLLSGTVIRLSMDAKPKTRQLFLKHRIARILPIYIVSIVLTIVISFLADKPPNLSTILGNLLFLQTLQGYISPTIITNQALWSLSFEVFFYLLYALTIGKNQKKMLYSWVGISTFALIIQIVLPLSGIFGHLTIMFAYSSIWLLGYYLVDLSKYLNIDLIFASASLGLLPILSRLDFSNYYLAAKHLLVAVTIIPLFVILTSNNKVDREQKRISSLTLEWSIWLIIYIIALFLNFRSQSLLISKIIYCFIPLFLATSTLLYKKYSRPIQINDQFWLMSGQLSYAFYIIHMPIIYALNLSSFTLGIKLALAIIVSVTSTYILEYYFHPPIARKILAYKQ